MNKPMTKDQAEQFLKQYPKPWREEYDCDRSRTFYISCKGNLEFQIDLEKLLRYVAYLEQQNEAMQGLIDIMGEDN